MALEVVPGPQRWREAAEGPRPPHPPTLQTETLSLSSGVSRVGGGYPKALDCQQEERTFLLPPCTEESGGQVGLCSLGL